MKPISFCINTAKNEKDYILLLLKSLKDHTQYEQHEVLVFVDTDNQNTYEALVEFKKELPTLKVAKNTSPYPVWSQRNVSILFNAAKNDIVCYLQSDMVVGKDFDKHIVANLATEKTVLCCARIEPPLHPPAPEKIVKSFGTSPEDFDYQGFNKFVDELQKENRPNMWGHFAPFALYKSTWFNELGGFDTQFRCSREDSDLIIRMGVCQLDLVQSWNACVYHFTCVSSRGVNWFTSDEQVAYKNELQQNADIQELKRFIRKWGFFGHHAKPVYDITFDIEVDRFVDMNLLKAIEPYCKRMYLSDSNIAYQLASQLQFESQYYSNLRWNYPNKHWLAVQQLYNNVDQHRRIRSSEDLLVGDVIVSCKYSELVKQFNDEVRHAIENIHGLVSQNEVGSYQYGPFTINITRKIDLTDTYRKVENEHLEIADQQFLFA